MGFPVCCAELLLPRLLLHALSILGLIRRFINTLFLLLGLPDFLEPDISWAQIDSSNSSPPPHHHHHHNHFQAPEFPSVSAVLIREILAVVKFSDLVDPSADSCAVCLYDFEDQDEIRRLTNCRHIFHKSCLDRWMGYDQVTCPLCRTPVIPDDMQEVLNERLWAASGIPDFYGVEYNTTSYQIPAL